MNSVESRYLDGDYRRENADWHAEDAGWKAGLVAGLLADHRIAPASLCDVGCGSGDVLAHLQLKLPRTRLVGFEVSPQAAELWPRHQGLELHRGSFHDDNRETYDVVTMLDVFEHVTDPFKFLRATLPTARHFVFHIPLDLSALAVARNSSLLYVRRRIGHLHLYTKDLALETLWETGYEDIEWRYTGACFAAQTHRRMLAKLAALPRRLAFAIHKDLGVRLLGGETLLVLAKPAAR